MKIDQLENKIAKTLCASSVIFGECPFCVNGICQPIMWTAFRQEAKAVIQLLKNENFFKAEKQLKLPGLGG